MKHEVRTTGNLSPATLESLVLRGDLSGLTPGQKVEYACYRASQLGLDPAAKPFEIMRLNNREVLYATAGLTQQLCESRNLSVGFPIPSERIEDVVMVTARVTDPKGRSTENVGAVGIGNAKGDALANALMKARTKAIRRTVLAHCGLGMLDETEVETIPGAVVETLPGTVYSRPGDAPTTVEPEPDEEWTEDARETAKMALMDAGEAMCATGWTIDDPKIQATLAKYRGEIGDPQFTLSNWQNRLALAVDRACKAAPKPSTEAPGDPSPTTKPTGSLPSLASLEESADKELGSTVSDLWFKLRDHWNAHTKDGRKLQETHMKNRIAKRIADWAPGLHQGSREWLLAVAEGQIKELQNGD